MAKLDEDKAVDVDEKVKARAAEIESEQGKGESDADDDRDDRAARPEPADEPAPRERSRDRRWREAHERADRAEVEAKQLRDQVSQLLGVMQERARSAEPKEPAADPYAERLDKIKRERNLLYREIQAGSGKLTQEQLDTIEKRAHALEEEHVETLAERLVSKRGLGQQRPQEHPLKPFLALQFPDVVQNPKAVDYARAYFQMETAKGRPESVELVMESHQRAREALRTAPGGRSRPADPNAATRRAGLGAGPGTGAGDEAALPGMTREQRKMADALYSDEPDEKKRHKRWAEGPGRRLAAKS